MDEQQKAYMQYLKSQGLSAEEAYKHYTSQVGEGAANGNMLQPPQSQAADGAAQPKSIDQSLMDYLSTYDPYVIAAKKVGQAALPVAQAAGTALGYLGGVTRTGLGSLSDAVAGTKLTKSGDMFKALGGEAPSSAEMLERQGVGSGGSLSDMFPGIYSETGEGMALQKGGMLDPTARGAAGFVLDQATDPLTYIGIRGAAGLIEKGGEKLFKGAKALKHADKVAEIYGKKPVSDVLFKNGVWGTASKIEEKAGDLASNLGKSRDALVKQADQNLISKGADVVDEEAIIRPVKEKIAEWKVSGDPALEEAASNVEKRLKPYDDKFSREPHVKMKEGASEIVLPKEYSIEELGKLKTNIYKQLPKNAYNQSALTPLEDDLMKLFGRGAKEEIEKSVSRGVSPEAGQQLKNLNEDVGTLLTTQQKLMQEGKKTVNSGILTGMDGVMMGLTHGNPAAIAVKKSADLLKSNFFRTGAGLGINRGAKAAGKGLEKVGLNNRWADVGARVGLKEFSKERKKEK